jgi:hypothetical protein
MSTKTHTANTAAVLIRCCDRCGCDGAQWVQTPGLVTVYGDDGWECVHVDGCPE